jgi:hypothetical protein
MRARRALAVLPVAMLVACAAGYTKDPSRPAAALDWARPTLEGAEIHVLESDPPRFELVLTREMPTPGYRFEIDSLEVDAEAGRIVAKVTDVPPDGMVAQVITPTRLRLSLGTLPVGRYVLEIRTCRGTGDHRLLGARVLVATGP